MQNRRSVIALRTQKMWPTILNSKWKVTLRFRSWGSEPKAKPHSLLSEPKQKTPFLTPENNYSTTLSHFSGFFLSPLQQTLLQKDHFFGVLFSGSSTWVCVLVSWTKILTWVMPCFVWSLVFTLIFTTLRNLVFVVSFY